MNEHEARGENENEHGIELPQDEPAATEIGDHEVTGIAGEQPADNAGPAAEATDPAAEAAPGRRRVRRLVTLGLAAAVLVTAGAGGGALLESHLEQGRQTTSAVGTPGAFGPGGSSGSSSGYGWTGPTGPGDVAGGSTGSGTSGNGSATPATAEQTAGLVTIVSTLGYQSGESAGTGIILTSSGEILTNNHVIDGATSVAVTVESTDRSYTATVVGTDAKDDIAVLRLTGASGLTPATLASSGARVNDAVTAVGNAGGTGSLSTATGTVTALGQTITTEAEGSAASETLSGLIETDADVVSGDSGGPLENASGQVVGIDTAAGSGTAQVRAYAIPISTAVTIAAEITSGRNTGDITIGLPAFLGVEVASAASTGDGATISGVVPGTPAASAGLAAGDTITSVDGHAIGTGDDLTSRLSTSAPGDTVAITYSDENGASHSASVRLTTGPAD